LSRTLQPKSDNHGKQARCYAEESAHLHGRHTVTLLGE